mgnify:CR=1 FL=1
MLVRGLMVVVMLVGHAAAGGARWINACMVFAVGRSGDPQPRNI